jgi:hypothetical protein
VYKHPRFVVRIWPDGKAEVQPMVKGEPIGKSFMFPGWQMVYHDGKQYHTRKVLRFDDPPLPSVQPGRIRLKAEAEDRVDVELEFLFKGNALTVTMEIDEPKSITYPSRADFRAAPYEGWQLIHELRTGEKKNQVRMTVE